MVTAQRWHEYQENYKRYGIDMRDMEIQAPRIKKNPGVSAKDKARMIVYAVIVGILCICIIISTAYAASLKYDINSMLAQNTEIKREIEILNVEIKTSANISSIEERAVNELGMIYPQTQNIVYIVEKPKPATDFAMLLKEQAYN